MDNDRLTTTVYFVRHAESDATVRDGRIRPLTVKGLRDAQRIIPAFSGIHIDRIYSSPFKRAIDTVKPLADISNMVITVIEDLRERRSDSIQTIPMAELIRRQWYDFSYTLSDGENLRTVQDRNINALRGVLSDNAGKTVLIGTHGMALCTMMKYFNDAMDANELFYILPTLPYIVRMVFTGSDFVSMEEVKTAIPSSPPICPS